MTRRTFCRAMDQGPSEVGRIADFQRESGRTEPERMTHDDWREGEELVPVLYYLLGSLMTFIRVNEWRTRRWERIELLRERKIGGIVWQGHAFIFTALILEFSRWKDMVIGGSSRQVTR
jgi:hypothetical protein